MMMIKVEENGYKVCDGTKWPSIKGMLWNSENQYNTGTKSVIFSHVLYNDIILKDGSEIFVC